MYTYTLRTKRLIVRTTNFRYKRKKKHTRYALLMCVFFHFFLCLVFTRLSFFSSLPLPSDISVFKNTVVFSSHLHIYFVRFVDFNMTTFFLHLCLFIKFNKNVSRCQLFQSTEILRCNYSNRNAKQIQSMVCARACKHANSNVHT